LISSYVVGRQGGQAYLARLPHSGGTSVSHWPDISMAIAAATGISGGAAHTIGGLLAPETGGWAFSDLRRPRLRSPKLVDGVPCYRVTGLQGSVHVTVYVGIQDLLIRKFLDRKGKGEEVRLGIDIRAVHAPELFRAPLAEA